MTGLTPEAELAGRHARDLTAAIMAVVDPALKEKDDTIRLLTATLDELAREIKALKAQAGEIADSLATDDLADAAADRKRDEEFRRSADYQARGERE